jgi:hypothetical protein
VSQPFDVEVEKKGGELSDGDEDAGRSLHASLVLLFLFSSSHRIVSASAFFFSREWPLIAPARRDFMTARTVTVGTTGRRAEEDMTNGLSAGESEARRKKKEEEMTERESFRREFSLFGRFSRFALFSSLFCFCRLPSLASLPFQPPRAPSPSLAL